MATDKIKIDTEEAYKSSVLWHKSADELPKPFVSVLAYVPDEAPLHTVHEGYVDLDGKWHLLYCGYHTGVNVTHWMDMDEPPKCEC